MLVSLTQERVLSLIEVIKNLLTLKHPTIRDLAKVIGKLVAAFPGCVYGPLHYRTLEHEKSVALHKAKGDFHAPIHLSDLAKNELDWWVHNIATANNPIVHTHPDIVVESDASHLGWGAVCNGKSTGGRWTTIETQQHINVLELQAAFFALKTFCNDTGGQNSGIASPRALKQWSTLNRLKGQPLTTFYLIIDKLALTSPYF